jgi:hypothetical protein
MSPTVQGFLTLENPNKSNPQPPILGGSLGGCQVKTKVLTDQEGLGLVNLSTPYPPSLRQSGTVDRYV